MPLSDEPQPPALAKHEARLAEIASRAKRKQDDLNRWLRAAGSQTRLISHRDAFSHAMAEADAAMRKERK